MGKRGIKRIRYMGLGLLIAFLLIALCVSWCNFRSFIPGSYVVKYEKFGECYEVACRCLIP